MDRFGNGVDVYENISKYTQCSIISFMDKKNVMALDLDLAALHMLYENY